MLVTSPGRSPISAGAGPAAGSSPASAGSSAATNMFKVAGVLGEGAFGKVLLVKERSTGQYYAMKRMNKQSLNTRKKVEQAVNERKVLASINSPFCVMLRGAFQDKNSLFLIMEVRR